MWSPDLEGEILQRVRGVIAAAVVAVPFGIFLAFWLHATREFAILIGSGIGLAIFAIVATRRDSHDDAADVAWREAALDLPPVSDRIILERVQARMPGPEKQRRTGARNRDDIEAAPSDAASQGADPK